MPPPSRRVTTDRSVSLGGVTVTRGDLTSPGPLQKAVYSLSPTSRTSVPGGSQNERFMERSTASIRLSPRELYYHAPFLDFLSDELSEIGGRTRNYGAG